MEPVTHALIGAALYKVSGGQVSFADPQFVSVVAGAMAPDLDIILRRWGQYAYIKNHRGFSHSIVGIIGFAALTALSVCVMFNSSDFLSTFLFALIGCFSHTATDVLNSYGARMFWPFVKRKVALNVLVLFDPIIFVLLLGIVLLQNVAVIVLLNILVTYILFRILSKITITYTLAKAYNVSFKRVKVIPSVVHLNTWHFVIKFENYSIVGQKNVFKKGMTILRRFYNIDNKMRETAMNTKVGRFFKDFAPLFCVNHEYRNGENIFTFTDMRHHLSGNFMHHATVTFTDDFELKEQIFYPYSQNRRLYL